MHASSPHANVHGDGLSFSNTISHTLPASAKDTATPSAWSGVFGCREHLSLYTGRSDSSTASRSVRSSKSTTTPVPHSYTSRNDSDVVDINGRMRALLAGPGYADVVTADLYGAVVARCRRHPASANYPRDHYMPCPADDCDCAVLQSRGVHFSDAGKLFTSVFSAAAIQQWL